MASQSRVDYRSEPRKPVSMPGQAARKDTVKLSEEEENATQRRIASQERVGEPRAHPTGRPLKTKIITADERSFLKNILEEKFDMEEIKEISFEMKIDYEMLEHHKKGVLIRDLIRYCERLDRVGDLVAHIIHHRPRLRARLHPIQQKYPIA